MKKSGVIVLLAFALALVSASAFAQSSNMSSLSGVVVDKDGGVMPGATVVAKNNATGASLQTVTNSAGVFSFPALEAGSYNVKISLQSFKTEEYKDVRILSATPGNLPKTILQIGAMSETVEVRGTTDLIRTTTPTVNMTVTGEFIESLPRGDRNALSFTIFLPGVSTSGGNQNSRSSTVAGLPQNTINITMDGISTSNNLQTTDGFFSMVTPRLDAVEEVTLTTAAAGADSSGQGSVQIRFVTRSGTNQFNTSLYNYWQNKALNTNTFFNELAGLPRVRRTIDVYGGRVGGPIVIPGLVDGHGKAFFFFNQENNWAPGSTSRARTVLRDTASNPNLVTGDFTYGPVATPTTVNVLALAAARQLVVDPATTLPYGVRVPITLDPVVTAVLAAENKAAHSTGSLQTTASTPNTQTFNYQVTVASVRYSPTTRVDINLTPHHRLTGSYYLQRYKDSPDTLNNADPNFPGFPAQAAQNSYRTTGSSTFRSTFGTNMVNEVLVGWQSSPNHFFTDASNSMFTDPALDTKGYFLSMGFVTSPQTSRAAGPEYRNTVNWQANDSLNWLKGNHSFKFGVEFTRLINTQDDYTTANSITLGLSTNAANADPSLALFTSANFPGSNNTDLNNARSLYAMLTGHISSIGGTGQLDGTGTNYVFNGHVLQKERQDEWGFYASDSWRVKPNVTITAGLRYELQMPVVALVGLLTGSQLADVCGMSGIGSGIGGRQCNLFQPTVQGDKTFVPVWNGTAWVAASTPSFNKLTANTKGYAIDKNNFAPSVGINWRPVVKSGFLRQLLGDPEQATVTGAFARTFNRERFDQFQNIYVGNPGSNTPGARGFGATNFILNPVDQACITANVAGGPACAQNAFPLLFAGGAGAAAGLSTSLNLLGGGDPTKLNSGPGFLGLTLPNGTPYTATATGVFPLKATSGQGIFVFDPNIQVPYTDSWTVGLQRSLSRDMAIEFRYIGNINQKPWTLENWNGANYRETGLIGANATAPNDASQADQFTKAIANLQANVNANRGQTFAYFGPGTGTVPLPLFLAHFSGVAPANAGDPSLYTSANWTSTTFTGNLTPFNNTLNAVSNIANTLMTTTSFLQNAIDTNSTTGAPGIYPANFWHINPAVGAADVTRNLGNSKYNSLQVDVRRRFSKGFQADFSYTYARGTSYSNVDLHRDLLTQRNGNTIPHAIKMLWVWDLPVGRGRRFGTNMNQALNAVIGGWQFSGTGRIQVPLFRLQNTLIFGMTQAQANRLLKSVILVKDSVTGVTTVRDMPQDVIDNTIKAYSGAATNPFWFPVTPATFGPSTNFGQTPGPLLTPATQAVPTGRFFAPAIRPAGAYGANDPGCFGLFSGDCAPDMFFYGKWFGEFDMKFLKKFQLPHKIQAEMDVEIFNALNAINFNGNLNPGTSATIFNITSQGSGAQTGAGRTAQLVWRVTW